LKWKPVQATVALQIVENEPVYPDQTLSDPDRLFALCVGVSQGDAFCMSLHDSALDVDAVIRLRHLVRKRRRIERTWPMVVAAMLLTVAAFGFAAAMILAPPVVTEQAAESGN
jgi:hypothetical protein